MGSLNIWDVFSLSVRLIWFGRFGWSVQLVISVSWSRFRASRLRTHCLPAVLLHAIHTAAHCFSTPAHSCAATHAARGTLRAPLYAACRRCARAALAPLPPLLARPLRAQHAHHLARAHAPRRRRAAPCTRCAAAPRAPSARAHQRFCQRTAPRLRAALHALSPHLARAHTAAHLPHRTPPRRTALYCTCCAAARACCHTHAHPHLLLPPL